MKKIHLALSGALMLAAAAAFAPAQAGPQVWHAITQAGGAPGNPALWDQEAGYRTFGTGSAFANVSVSPQFVDDKAITYDQSTTNVQGGQLNVQTNANGDGLTVNTTTNGGN